MLIVINHLQDVMILEIDVCGCCELRNTCLHITIGEVKHCSETQAGFEQLACRLAAVAAAARAIAQEEQGITSLFTTHLSGDLYLARPSSARNDDLLQQKQSALLKFSLSARDCTLNVRII